MENYKYTISKLSFLLGLILIFTGCSSIDKKNTENKENDLYEFLSEKITQYKNDPAVNASEIAQDFYLRGLTEVSNENHVSAIYHFEHALKFEKSATVYLSLAESYLALNDTFGGLEAAMNAYKLDNKNKRALEIIYSIFAYGGDYPAAEKVINELYFLYPTKENLLTLADFYSFYNPQKSIEYFENYISKYDSEDVEFKYNNLLFSNGRQESAIHNLMISFKKSPSFEKLNQFNYFAVQSGKFNEIDKFITEIQSDENVNLNDYFGNLIFHLSSKRNDIDINKTKYFSYLNEFKKYSGINALNEFDAVLLAFSLGDTSLVEYFLPRVINKVDTLSKVPIYCSEIYSLIGKREQALKILLEYKDVFKDDSEYLAVIGYWYYTEKKYKEALEYMLMFKDRNPESAESYTQIADSYDKLEDIDKAEEYYKIALSKDADNPGANNNYAYFLSKFPERLSEAEVYSKLSIEKEPEIAAYLDTYGWILYKQGKIEDSLYYIILAAEKDPKNWEIFEHLGDIYFSLSDISNAENNWTKALKLDPNNLILKEKLNKLFK